MDGCITLGHSRPIERAGDAGPAEAAIETAVPARVVVLLAVQVLLLVLFAASTLLRSRPGFDAALDGWLGDGAQLLPAAVFLARAHAVRQDRKLFVLLAAVVVMSAAASILFDGWLQFQDPIPCPSWADAPSLTAYGILILCVARAARPEVAGLAPSVWLDALAGGLGVAAVGSALGVRTIRAGAGDLSNAAGLAVNLAYPIADLLLVVFVVGIFALTGARPAPRWRWLGAGLLCLAAADTAHLLRLATDSYVPGTPLDALWVLGLTLMAAAALSTSGGRSARPDAGGALVVGMGSRLLAVVVLAVAARIHMPMYVVGLAVASLVVAFIRTAMGFRALRLLAETRWQARTDELTGLPNRRAFYEHLQQLLPGHPPTAVSPGRDLTHRRVAILLLDLDRFKEVNDGLGHHAGDQLLRLVGHRLRTLLRPGDVLARLGGDEFAVVLPATDPDTAQEIAHRLARAFVDPLTVDGVNLHVGASIGIAVSPEHATDGAGLLQRADVAMYAAKGNRSAGASTKMYEPDRDEHSRARLQILADLRHALTRNEIVVHYQPQYDLARRVVVGVEALVRWQHPAGLLMPDVFLPLAEQSGAMPALTLKVLHEALAQCRDWHLDGLDLTVAVNVGASSLLDERLPMDVADALARHRLPGSALKVEITESTLVADLQRAGVTLEALRKLGVQLSIDDYGTGYCSLSYLRNLPPMDELKLDRSFIRALTPGSRDAAIVRSTIELTRALGLGLVAEGVEDADSLAVLHDLGCDFAQGYHLGPPQPADGLIRWLRNHDFPAARGSSPRRLLAALPEVPGQTP
jgi:diguanylate cyclase (GGDEF)-like protein